MNGYTIVFICALAYAAAEMAPPLPYAASSPSQYISNDDDGQPMPGYVQQYNNGPDGFNIQSGFEGYLVPTASGTHTLLPLREGLEALGIGAGAGLKGLVGLKGLKWLKWLKPIAKFGLKVVPKIGVLAAGIIALFVVGGIFTTAVCTFTPFCTISFLGLGLTRESMRSYFTQDRLSATSAFVVDAIKKYGEMYEMSNEIESDKNEIKQ